MAFYRLEPWGSDFELRLADALATSLAGILPVARGASFTPPSQFMARARLVALDQSPEEQISLLKAVSAANTIIPK